ncbi:MULTISPECIES: ABC transporter substrate-binding protein [Demequina]|uniref:ABC transporter substrate-binding protein n=1 Tax=Demequina TaxID=577469 RepID=UPI000AC39567|nr:MULTISPECIES: extracellular solute-binding protein [Demequina]
MKKSLIRGRRGAAAFALVGAGAIVLTACSGSSSPSSSGSDEGSGGSGEFTYLGQIQNTTIATTLTTLSTGACSAENEAATLSEDSIDSSTWDQQLQLLAGQDALASISMAPGTPALMQDFISSGKVVDLSTELDTLGVSDKVLPAAASTIEALYGADALYALPTEFNIEGFWYNKQLLEDNGIDVPATWDDLVTAAGTLDAAGVQPFVASGGEGWPVTRLVGDYIFRDLGADALQKVADGEASLTDPEYVAAADAIAELGSAGYFGASPGTVDYDTAMNQFLTGGGAFFYMGSWAVSNFNDREQNQIGADNIGFMPFPEVTGGAGSIDEVPANAGVPVMLSSATYGDDTAAWLKCIVENYGDVALADSGQVTGFAVTEVPADQPELTTLVQDTIANAPSSVLWFEAKFSAQGTSVSQTNGGALASGQLSGEEFMSLVQAANEG